MVWRDIPGWEDLYQVSDQGEVKSLARVITMSNGITRTIRERILKPGGLKQGGKVGYLSVILCANAIVQETHQIHRLVLRAFVGPCPPGMETRHLNGDRTDNRLANLRYGTRSENIRDQVRHGTHHRANRDFCPQGHPYDEENTYIPPNSHRRCRTCRHELRVARAG